MEGRVGGREAGRDKERINGIIAVGQRSFAGERADDWPALVSLVEFAINDSKSLPGRVSTT